MCDCTAEWTRHAIEALAAATVVARGNRVASVEATASLRSIAAHGNDALFAAMLGWCRILRDKLDLPAPDTDHVYGVTAWDPNTGNRRNPEEVLQPGLLAGLRVQAALLNEDLDTAGALFAAAIRDDLGSDVVQTVLYQVARQLVDHAEQKEV